MNRRRVSSPPTARARLPLDLSHPFTALDARHATESTTEGLNESTIARANHTECDDFHAEPVHRPPHTFASLETFVRSRHRRVRRVRRGPSSRSPARVVIHFIRMACMRARRSTWGGYTTSHDPSIPLFVSFSSPNDQKKKSSTPAIKTNGIHTSHDPP